MKKREVPGNANLRIGITPFFEGTELVIPVAPNAQAAIRNAGLPRFAPHNAEKRVWGCWDRDSLCRNRN